MYLVMHISPVEKMRVIVQNRNILTEHMLHMELTKWAKPEVLLQGLQISRGQLLNKAEFSSMLPLLQFLGFNVAFILQV